MNLQVDPEFQSIFGGSPELQKSVQEANLEEQIVADGGPRDAIIVWRGEAEDTLKLRIDR